MKCLHWPHGWPSEPPRGHGGKNTATNSNRGKEAATELAEVVLNGQALGRTGQNEGEKLKYLADAFVNFTPPIG
jgi:hypothetical protein